MSISLKTHKILWGMSGNMCAFPDCKKELLIGENETDDPSIIGDEAHIVGRKQTGPRGKSQLPIEQRDKYGNLILLCRVHHKLIDDQVNTYPVEKLHEFKKQHEEWVKNNLSQDTVKQREDEVYSSYVDKFIELAEVNKWMNWTSLVFGGSQPQIRETILEKLKKLNEFILSRVWYNRYPELETAFFNFKNISNDFINLFEQHSSTSKLVFPEEFEKIIGKNLKDEKIRWIRKFYEIKEYNEEKYSRLLKKYEYHCLLIEDLTLEMTRAANYLFDMVRKYLFSGFRTKEGILLVQLGPFKDHSFITVKTEYRGEERKTLYQGLKIFMKERESRNYYRGVGVNEDYFPKYH